MRLDVLRAVGHGRGKLARGERDSGSRGRSQESGGSSIHDNKCPSLGKPKERTMVTSIAWTKAALRGSDKHWPGAQSSAQQVQ